MQGKVNVTFQVAVKTDSKGTQGFVKDFINKKQVESAKLQNNSGYSMRDNYWGQNNTS